MREARWREGSYLLRSNLTGKDAGHLEQAFKELADDLAIRPIYHQTYERIEAHIVLLAGHPEAAVALSGTRSDAPLGAKEDGGAADG